MANPFKTAAAAVALLAILMWLYVREFSVLSNTLEARYIVFGSMLVVALLVGGALWYRRDRFTPMDRHLPEVMMILIFSVLFAPFFGSLLNRSFGKDETQSFEFMAETAYFSSGYGILKGERLKPTGWRLTVREGKKIRTVKYKRQAYYPLTKPGDQILLPVRKGIFGARVVTIQ